MGQGEEGLRRALSWGKRRVTGKIIHQEEEIARENIDLSQIKIVKMNTKVYIAQQKQKISEGEKIQSIFKTAVTKNTPPEKIKELQTILATLSYYDGDIDGKYSSVLEDAIADFQLENQLIPSKKNIASGFYGVKTRAKLEQIYILFTENEKIRIEKEMKIAQEKTAEEARLALVKAKQQKQEEAHKMEVALFVKNLGTPKSDEVGAHVRNLQQSLKSLGYFHEKDTAIFGKLTRNALIQYQTDKKISSDELGKLGKSTKEALFRDLLSSKTNKDDSKKEDV